MNALSNNCVPVKLSALAQLVRLLTDIGVSSTKQLVEVTGYSRRAIIKAKGELDWVSTRVHTGVNPGALLCAPGCAWVKRGAPDDLSHVQNSGQNAKNSLPPKIPPPTHPALSGDDSSDSANIAVVAAAAAEPEDPTSKISAKNRRPLAARLKAIIGDRPCQGDPAETILVLSDTFTEDVIGEALTRLALRVTSGEKFSIFGRILPLICADIREEEEERARHRKPKMRNLWVPDYMQ